jgi:hypothetical protein
MLAPTDGRSGPCDVQLAVTAGSAPRVPHRMPSHRLRRECLTRPRRGRAPACSPTCPVCNPCKDTILSQAAGSRGHFPARAAKLAAVEWAGGELLRTRAAVRMPAPEPSRPRKHAARQGAARLLENHQAGHSFMDGTAPSTGVPPGRPSALPHGRHRHNAARKSAQKAASKSLICRCPASPPAQSDRAAGAGRARQL